MKLLIKELNPNLWGDWSDSLAKKAARFRFLKNKASPLPVAHRQPSCGTESRSTKTRVAGFNSTPTCEEGAYLNRYGLLSSSHPKNLVCPSCRLSGEQPRLLLRQ
jgi:hypothetical protein